ncbi:hypothetical protein OBBRIDRAFT_724673 [Obba rivulosa]|uniref:Uncharacterized protein n=1 Tax=Obba rivulosa TaxID=1052685 RepID=A0A8E2DPP8_9APHY|nr:hypothetical protein OBBRIDRAFT_724673 [Obba rivulosa]
MSGTFRAATRLQRSIPSSPLPPAFTSLYRLFLRATAASVLHHRPAARRLRKLWRPTFEGAVRVIRKLESSEALGHEQQRLQRWYAVWEQRIDNTLSLLCTSADSRGLAHSLTKNLQQLYDQHADYQRSRLGTRSSWNPQLPPDSPEYKPLTGAKAIAVAKKREFRDRGWGALGEVIVMAEARQGMSLGRLRRRWK